MLPRGFRDHSFGLSKQPLVIGFCISLRRLNAEQMLVVRTEDANTCLSGMNSFISNVQLQFESLAVVLEMDRLAPLFPVHTSKRIRWRPVSLTS